jgi:hypothetical protein
MHTLIMLWYRFGFNGFRSKEGHVKGLTARDASDANASDAKHRTRIEGQLAGILQGSGKKQWN